MEVAMKFLATGIDYSTRELLVPPIEEEKFVEAVTESLERNKDELARARAAATTGVTYRDEIERQREPDLGNPLEAGWTILVNEADPNGDVLLEALRPLAEKRGMRDPASPLLFRGEPQLEWQSWLDLNYSPFLTEDLPYYVLIAGDPDQVPFHFQAFLDSVAAVGRVAFDSVDHLQHYVEKLIRLEEADDPAAEHEIAFFAPDAGEDDPTYFSRRYLAEPLIARVRERHGFEPRAMVAADATKERLQETVLTTRAALVYTASHGVGAQNEPLETQVRVNGAIVCQPSDAGDSDLFTADDIPLGDPVLEGSVFFQFACFGYGTPAESDYMHWLGAPELNSDRDFVAALPKRLLAHPRGPIAFVGHVDTAWLHGFDDPENPYVIERAHPRLMPFAKAVDSLLETRPLGLALEWMNRRYATGSAVLSSALDRMRRPGGSFDQEMRAGIADAFIFRSDAQNYHVFGDPAARLRIPAR
jgi:hypothetical protein